VWTERAEFYKSALPRTQDEEQFMLQLALEQSQRQQLQQHVMTTRDPWLTDISQL